ncbi:hypothetical protein [Pseudomonas oryzihabitans]|uniref:PD-(D/E)XK nuclease superfamily protein n=1 Tax=Pseudomonas oryzihabitans TaxID=47885 RepID=A0AAJ2EUN2_9PSED|nr:hypothetical protein [Pseudomonas psychrotolerans]MDR6232782.1 hypothetical protein [Pseudomonas psychrotolerans]MDR6358283.1 hypothetical protein [Pseudomonas psychrotolerans]
MLQAFYYGKSRLHQRYMGYRDAGETRVSEEDEITALIMGPLEFLPPADVGKFWRALVEPTANQSQLPFPKGLVECASLHFWPRRGIEPDLLVELCWPTGERRLLLVEFKWKAPLSGDDQLHRQWQEFLTNTERQQAYHLFIAPDISSGLNAKSEKDIWEGRLILHSWLSVLGLIRTISTTGSPGLDRWQARVTDFLRKVGIRRFQGFINLGLPTYPQHQPVFWCALDGFLALNPPPRLSLSDTSTHFIWGSNNEQSA